MEAEGEIATWLELRTGVLQLREALEHRPVIDQAVARQRAGITAGHLRPRQYAALWDSSCGPLIVGDGGSSPDSLLLCSVVVAARVREAEVKDVGCIPAGLLGDARRVDDHVTAFGYQPVVDRRGSVFGDSHTWVRFSSMSQERRGDQLTSAADSAQVRQRREDVRLASRSQRAILTATRLHEPLFASLYTTGSPRGRCSEACASWFNLCPWPCGRRPWYGP